MKLQSYYTRLNTLLLAIVHHRVVLLLLRSSDYWCSLFGFGFIAILDVCLSCVAMRDVTIAELQLQIHSKYNLNDFTNLFTSFTNEMVVSMGTGPIGLTLRTL